MTGIIDFCLGAWIAVSGGSQLLYPEAIGAVLWRGSPREEERTLAEGQ